MTRRLQDEVIKVLMKSTGMNLSMNLTGFTGPSFIHVNEVDEGLDCAM